MDGFRKLFCEFSGVPINIYSNPHFVNRLHLLTPIYHTDEKWTEFMRATDVYKTEKSYIEHVNNLTAQIGTLISTRLTPDKVNRAVRGLSDGAYDRFIKRDEIFNLNNVGRKFARLYIRDKAFYVLRWIDSSIVDTKINWVEFIRKYTDDRNIICNFPVQERVLGLDTNDLMMYALDCLTIKMLVESVFKCFSYRDVARLCDGEIYISLPQDHGVISYNNLNSELMKWSKATGIPFELEVFRVGYFRGADSYIKRFETGKTGKADFELVGTDPAMAAFIARRLFDQPVTHSDMYFTYKGRLAQFTKVPVIEEVGYKGN